MNCTQSLAAQGLPRKKVASLPNNENNKVYIDFQQNFQLPATLRFMKYLQYAIIWMSILPKCELFSFRKLQPPIVKT